jgi:predicted enzyme related to lactoylglutathione lyase
MSAAARTGTLIYAKDLTMLASFYTALLAMTTTYATDEIVVLHSPDGQLILHQIPAHIAETFVVDTPPVLREEAAIKPFFTVPSFAEAQTCATSLGGGLFGHQWEGPGFRVTNAYDPEGNIIQLRAPLDGARVAP